MKVALVYDRVNKWGGAERVLLALHKLFPDAPLFTSVHKQSSAQWADIFAVKTSFLQKAPLARSRHEFLPLLMPIAFESFSFDAFDLVISVTSEAAKGIITKPHTKHIYYCLTPTRYLWSGYDMYFKNPLFKALSKPAVLALRKWDRIAANRPDVVIAISEEIKGRIKKYYGRDSMIVYPPTTLENPKSPLRSEASEIRNPKKGEYFLVVSRFVPYKRIDIAIDACNQLKLPLKIVGTGSFEKELRRKAGSTIEFLGNLTDNELADYYKHCKALIFPGIEDFGLVMAEAHRFGKPVIAFRGGGALDIVKEGVTGKFFNEQTKESLIELLQKFDMHTFDPQVIMKHVEKFGFENFKKNFLAVVNKIV